MMGLLRMPTTMLRGFVAVRLLALISIVSLLTLIPISAVMAQSSPEEQGDVMIRTSLVAESARPAAGEQTTLAVVMQPQDGWHGYWKQPGNVGLAPQFDWQLPDDVTAGEPAYPVPETLLIDNLMNHVYEHPYAILVPLNVPDHLDEGTTIPVRVDLQYLACREDACIPERASLSTDLTVGDGATSTRHQPDFDRWREALPRPLGARAPYAHIDDRIRISIPLPASVELDQPHLFVASDGAVDPAAKQDFKRQGDELIVETAAGEASPEPLEAVVTLAGGTGLAFQADAGSVPTPGVDRHGTGDGADEKSSTGTLGMILPALLGAVAGGILLNVMPCVFPILSLKILSLARLSGGPREARREALAYTAGVVGVCMLLGAGIIALRAAGIQIGWAFQLQDPRVIVGLTLLITAIAFNLTGLFELGGFNGGARLAEKGGATGAFWTGVLAAFVATPCSGPLMATALGAAILLPPLAALAIFAGLGFGIALPFLIVGYFPALSRKLPRPGPWMQSVRHFLAIPMFVTALALFWVLGQQLSSDGVVAILAVVMLLVVGLWLTGLRQRNGRRWSWGPSVVAAVMALSVGWLVPASFSAPPNTTDESLQRLTFNEHRLDELRQQDTPLFVYFTADWCVTCKVNEKSAIDREVTHDAFRQAGVTTMVGDWTNGDAAITTFLNRHDRTGVPLYLWYAPGAEKPRVLPQVLTPTLLTDLVAE
ncbi:protein-disulfide reductase DsbD domain-containing protein [Salinicola sp.]|uniref:protein-disulfide reductase DsbD family protein n=1 Tax=Salinicola sp. TaxID=1978524 RepID=UPI0025CE5B17|nr:protein-disulfide reductase DsbD domain-containing protein [Salinicola sp.]